MSNVHKLPIRATAEMSKLDKFQYRMEQARFARELFESGLRRYRAYDAKRKTVAKYYISVDEDDDLFDDINQMLIEDVAPEDQRSLVAVCDAQYNSLLDVNEYKLSLEYDGKFATHLTLDGHRVGVKISNDPEPDTVNGAGLDQADGGEDWLAKLARNLTSTPVSAAAVQASDDPNNAKLVRMHRRATFECDSLDARDAVVKLLEVMADKYNRSQRKTRFFIATPTGNWQYKGSVETRPLDSVVLNDDKLDHVMADVKRFIDAEARYHELGLPYHRGYLFWGPPGTGKTSLARAIASEYGFNLYVVALSALESDARMLDLMLSLGDQRSGSGRAMLVIEDIDIAHAAKNRDDSVKGVTLNGLLNALDGIGTPQGLVTVMTTNDRQILDGALVRPGRVDVDLEIGYLTDDQLERLVRRFHGRSLDLPPITGQVTPAQVIGLFKDDLEGEFLQERLARLVTQDRVEDLPIAAPPRPQVAHSPHGGLFTLPDVLDSSFP